MFIFCRKIKNLSIGLSLLIIIVSCGASIQMHTCNSEGISVVSINKITSSSTCGDCCDKHDIKLSFKKNNCCDDRYISAFFKADYIQTIDNFIFKKHLFILYVLNSEVFEFSQKLYPENKTHNFISLIHSEYSNSLLILKCVLNI